MSDDMLNSLEQARRALTSPAGRLASEDPCLGVVPQLAEAQGHLRLAARSAVRQHWERGRRVLLTSADAGEREQASSRLAEILRFIALHPSWAR